MDELVRYGPWILSGVALLLAGTASVSASRARARAAAIEQALVTLRTSSQASAARASSALTASAAVARDPRSTAFEERLGALEARIASLADAVAFVARPEPDDVAPMRPPLPTTLEPLATPRTGWRMFP